MRAVCVAMVLAGRVAAAQTADLGHKLPGGVGLDAGTQPEQGLYVADRVVWFASDRANDRNGDRVPIENLDIDAYGNVLGVSGTLQLDDIYLSAAAAAPIVRLSLNADVPEASIDRLGLGDVYVQPIQVGTRLSRVDAIASYSFYAPTRQAERAGPGSSQWSHQLSAGTTIFFDDQRGWRVSVLASYLHNRKKLGIDITRGDSIQIQGGAGGRVLDVVDIGIAGYAVWQVTDDSGPDLPDPLRGARERVFGLGPEVDVTIPSWRTRLTARFEWDIGGRARPVGTLLVVGATVIAWR
jgi:hypothetical protein